MNNNAAPQTAPPLNTPTVPEEELKEAQIFVQGFVSAYGEMCREQQRLQIATIVDSILHDERLCPEAVMNLRCAYLAMKKAHVDEPRQRFLQSIDLLHRHKRLASDMVRYLPSLDTAAQPAAESFNLFAAPSSSLSDFLGAAAKH